MNATFYFSQSYAANASGASLTTADINRDGNPDLVVAGTGSVGVLYGNAAGTTYSTTSLFTGSYGSVATADFDADGSPDVAAATAGSNASVSVALSSVGLQNAHESVQLSSSVTALTAADLNRDGHPDIVAVGRTSGGTGVLDLLINDGHGSFSASHLLTFAVGTTPTAVASADLNGDGRADIIVANADGSLDVLFGDGSGGFTSSATYQVGTDLTSLAVADLNRDGSPDIVATDQRAGGSGTVDVLLNTGYGTFGSATTYAAGVGPQGVAATDLNGDGIPDVVVADASDSATVLFGDGTGALAAGGGYDTSDGSTSSGTAVAETAITTADVNHDGQPDIVALGADGSVTVLGNAGGTTTVTGLSVSAPGTDLKAGRTVTFQLRTSAPIASPTANPAPRLRLNDGGYATYTGGLGTGTLSFSYTVASENTPDLRVTGLDDNGAALYSPATVRMQAGVRLSTGAAPVALAQADVNGDGIADLVALSGSTVRVLAGDGSGSFSASTSIALGFTATGLAVADIDRDGKADLVISGVDGSLLIEKGDGSGGFAPLTTLAFTAPAATGTGTVGLPLSGVQVADLDHNGTVDIVVDTVGTTSTTLNTLMGNGSGGFGATNTFTVAGQVQSFAVADVDGNGRPDLLLDEGSSLVSMAGLGNGRFGTARTLVSGTPVTSVTTADLTGTGKLAVVALEASARQAVVLGQGFTTTLSVGTSATSVVAGDFNDDGRMDLAVLGSDNTTRLFFGDGAGNFTAGPTYTGTAGAAMALTVDVNRDGRADIVAEGASGTVAVLLNTSTPSYGFSPAALPNLQTADTGITIDTIAPAVTVALATDSGASPIDKVTNQDKLKGTGDPNTLVTVVGSGLTLTTMSDVLGAWTLTPAGLPQGLQSVTVTETDGAGNTGTASLTFTYDNVAPAVTVALADDTGSSSTDAITRDPTLAGSGDPNAIVSVLDGNILTTTAADGRGHWQLTPTGLGDGVQTVTARETDLAGNTTVQTFTFGLDTTSPTVTATLLHDTGASATDGVTSDPTITGTGLANTTVTLVDGTHTYTTTSDASGLYTYTPSGLPQGTQTMVVSETDVAGNSGSAAVNFTLQSVHSTATVLLLHDTGSDPADTVTSDPTLTGTGLANATVTLVDGQASFTTTADGAGHWTYTPTGLSQGFQTIAVSEVDGAGNTANATATLTLDTVKPATQISLLSTSTASGTWNPAATGTGDPNALVTLVAESGAGNFTTYTTSANAAGAWSYGFQNLSAQSQTITAFETDAAGNTGSASAVFVPVTGAMALASSGVPAVKVGQTVVFTLTTGQPVKLTGSPTLSLDDGGTAVFDRNASSGNTLVFNYTVTAGQHSPNLTVTGLNLNGASVSVPAALSFAAAAPASAAVPAAGTTIAADVTGDGVADQIQVTGSGDVDVSVANGQGGYLPATTYHIGGTLLSVAAADLNGDGALDLVVVRSGGVEVLLNDGSGVFTDAASLTAPGTVSSVTTAASSRLGYADILVATGTGTDRLSNTSVAAGSFDPLSLVSSTSGVATNILVDTTMPNVTLSLKNDTGSSLTDGITSDPTVQGSGDPNAVVHLLIGNTSVTTTADGSGYWTFAPSGLNDGSVTVVATETDAAQNTGSASLTFTLDTTPPVLTAALQNDTSNDPTTNTTSNATLMGTAQHNATVVLTDNGLSFTTVANASGQWSLSPQGLTQGAQTAVAHETDVAGNSATASVTFNYDTVAPAVTATLLHDTGASATDGLTSNATVTGMGDPNASVVVVDGAFRTTVTADAGGHWTATPTNLLQGTQTLTATETDKAGNAATASLTFAYDSAAPAVTVALGDNTSTDHTSPITSDPKLTGGGDANAIVTVVDNGVSFTTTANGTGAWTLTPTGLSQGAQTVTVTETDGAGNAGTASLSFAYDNVRPAVTVALAHDTGPDATDGLTADPTLMGGGDAYATVTITDGARSFTTAADAAGHWTYAPAGLNQGNQTATVSETDAAGNTGTSSVTFNLLTRGPQPTVRLFDDSGSSPTDRVTNDARLAGTGNANTVVTLTDGGLTFTTTADNSGNWSTTLAGIPQGLQTVTATETDGAGNSGSGTLAFTYDTGSPPVAIGLSDVTGGATVGTPITSDPTLSGSGDANAVVTLTTSGGVTFTTATDTSGHWAFVPTDLPQGTQTITAAETDLAGNTATAATTFTLDTVTPAVTIGLTHDTGASATDLVTSNPALAGEGDPLTTVTLRDGAATFTTTADATGHWTYVPQGLAQGPQTITATETDAAGNVGTASVTLRLDTVAPRPTAILLSDTGASAGDGVTSNPTLTGIGDPNTAVTLRDGALAFQTTTDASGRWTYTPAGLAQGLQTVTVTQTDAAGNSGAASVGFTLDSVAPVVQIATPGILTNQGLQAIGGSVYTPGAGAAYLAGRTVAVTDNGTIVGYAGVDGAGNWSTTVGLSGSGANTLSASVMDVGGNTGTSATITDTLNTQAPLVTIASPGGLTSSRVQTITGQATTPGLGATYLVGTTVQLFDNGAAAGSAVVDGNGNWATQIALSGDGGHAVTAAATDVMGNTATSGAAGFDLDSTGPSTSFDARASFTSGSALTLSGTVSDRSGVGGVEIYNGATDLGAAAVGPNGTWSLTTDLGAGTYDSLQAYAHDSLGNSTLVSSPFTLVTGIADLPFVAQEFDHDAHGALTSIESYGPRGAMVTSASTNSDGTHTIYGTKNHQILNSWNNDVMTAGGVRDTFVFSNSFGQDEITDFYAVSAQHDTLDLSGTGLSSLAQALRHTTMADGNATIHVSPTDTITLDGVSKAQLKAHPNDFFFG